MNRSTIRALVALAAPLVLVPWSVPPAQAGLSCDDAAATIVGTASGGEVLTGTAGDDVIIGLDGPDTIDGKGGTDKICGGGGDDVLVTGSGSGDVVLGGAGNDRITVATDLGYGGGDEGDDLLVATAETVALHGDDGRDELQGSEFADSMDGGSGDDWIDARGGDDIDVQGGPGSDVIGGGTGMDVLHGGDDSDNVGGDRGHDDRVYGDAGNDDLFGESPGASVLGGDGNDDLFAKERGILLDGGGGDDTIKGSRFADTISGRGGNDTIDAGAGDDRPSEGGSIEGDAGDDSITGGDGTDELRGGDGNDVVRTGSGDDDRVFGGGGDDDLLVTVPGGAGFGEAGNDVLTTKDAKFVSLDAGPGDDVLRGGSFADTLDGGADDDTIRGGGAGDHAEGGSGDDGLEGGAAGDELLGGAGNDALNGDAGGDRLEGGGGNDNCSGGAGNDHCHGGSPGPARPTPSDPDFCDRSVETRKSCRSGELLPRSYTATSTGTVTQDGRFNHNVVATWTAVHTYELDEAQSTETYKVYALTDWTVDWAASGPYGTCSIDAPPVRYSSPSTDVNGALHLNLDQDQYHLWFALNRSAPAVQTCPPPSGAFDTVWGARIGGLTEFLPLDLTKQSLDGSWEDVPSEGDIVRWRFRLTPSEVPPEE